MFKLIGIPNTTSTQITGFSSIFPIKSLPRIPAPLFQNYQKWDQKTGALDAIALHPSCTSLPPFQTWNFFNDPWSFNQPELRKMVLGEIFVVRNFGVVFGV